MKSLLLGFCLAFMSFMALGGSLYSASAQVLDSSKIIGNDSILEVNDGEYGVRDLINTSGSRDQEGFQDLAEKIGEYVKQFSIWIGILITIYAGIELFFSRGKEEVFKEKIHQTIYLAVGYGVMILAATIVYNLFFGETGNIFFRGGIENEYAEYAKNTFAEMQGVFDYVTMFAIAVLLLLVTITTIQFILSAETDEAKERLQRQLIWGSVGVLVLNATPRLIGIFFSETGRVTSGGGSVDGIQILESVPDINSAGEGTILGEIVGWTNFMLGYVSFMAVVSIIVAGIFMIVHFGDEDRISKSKSILISAVIALVVCFSSWAAINYLLFPSGAAGP